MYINIEKKAAITRLLLSLPVLSIQIMFSFSFSLYFESFKYYKYYNYLCIKELYKYIYLLISYEFLDCFMHKIKCRRRKMILAIIFTFQLTIVSLLCLEIVLFTIWYLNDGWGHRLSNGMHMTTIKYSMHNVQDYNILYNNAFSRLYDI
jgi:hypothetical protein